MEPWERGHSQSEVQGTMRVPSSSEVQLTKCCLILKYELHNPGSRSFDFIIGMLHSRRCKIIPYVGRGAWYVSPKPNDGSTDEDRKESESWDLRMQIHWYSRTTSSILTLYIQTTRYARIFWFLVYSVTCHRCTKAVYEHSTPYSRHS